MAFTFEPTMFGGWSLDRPSSRFPDPFFDYASTVMPQTLRRAHRYCELVFYSNPLVREAARRVLAFFATKAEVRRQNGEQLGADEADKYNRFLEETLDSASFMQAAGLDYIAFGNSFISVIERVRRYLRCPRCGAFVPAREFLENSIFKSRWQIPKFFGTCPHSKGGRTCGYSGVWTRVDRRSGLAQDLYIRRWSIHEIDIRFEPTSGVREYEWRISGTEQTRIREGDPLYLEHAPWEIIECVAARRNLKFAKNQIYHGHEPTLCGQATGGWGISKTLVNFRHAWYWQMLHRAVETFAADYTIPMRVITPAEAPGADGDTADPYLSIDLGGLRGDVTRMIHSHRYDPAETYFLGNPVNFQLLGGDASKLVPVDLFDQATAVLLGSFGFPVDLFKGSLTTQGAIPAIRMFQASWAPLVHVLNSMIGWVLGRVCEITGWEPVTARLASPVLVDDIQNAMARLQLSQTGDVSKTDALKGLGLEYDDQLRKTYAEKQMAAKEEARAREQADEMAMSQELFTPPAMQAAQQAEQGAEQGGQGAQAPPGVAGAQATGGPPPMPPASARLEEVAAYADTWAQYLYSRSDSERQSMMTELKGKNPGFHAAVKQNVEDMRQKAQTQAGEMLLKQQGGAPPQ